MTRCLVAAALIVCTPPPAVAAEFSGYAALTSDYVKRGVTQSAADAAWQLAGDIVFDSGWYLGVWGSTIDINNGPSRHRDREVNLYAGYAYDVSALWRVSALAVAYEYPGQTGNIDYNYVEYSVSANFDDRFWLEYSYSPDLYHTETTAANLEAYAELPLSNHWSIGAGAGYYDVAELTGTGYGYWQLGLTASFQHADIDLRYHEANRPVPFISTAAGSRSRLAITIRFLF